MLATVPGSGLTSPTLAPQIALLPDIHKQVVDKNSSISSNKRTSFLNYLPDIPNISDNNSNSKNSNTYNQSTHSTRYLTETTATPIPTETTNLAANQIVAAIKQSELHYGINGFLPKLHQKEAKSFVSMMITKSDQGYYVFNNITLKVMKKYI